MVPSVIGQLFHTFNTAARRRDAPAERLESVTEDSHTRNLLFPDPALLHSHEGQWYPLHGPLDPGTFNSGAGSFDDLASSLDLESGRDIRIIVAQDESGGTGKVVLFDSAVLKNNGASEPSNRPVSSGFGDRRLGNDGAMQRKSVIPSNPWSGQSGSASHSRRTSLSSEYGLPRSPGPILGPGFQRSRLRGGSISSMPNIDETGHGRFYREVDRETEGLLDCMFGSTPSSYRGPCTKIHELPPDSKAVEPSLASPVFGDSSFGRAEGRRRSNLAQSFSASDAGFGTNDYIKPTPASAPGKDGARKLVMCTRMFAVTLPDDEFGDSANERTPTPGNSFGSTHGFPFPSVSGSGNASLKPGRRPRPTRRLPMYAVAIIISMPSNPSANAFAASNRFGNIKGIGRPSGTDSAASSLETERKSGWTFLDAPFTMDPFVYGNDFGDDCIDIGDYYDVISRTLSSLQFLAQEHIVAQLKLVEAVSPSAIAPIPIEQVQGKAAISLRAEQYVASQRRNLKLQPHALATNFEVAAAAKTAATRIVRGIKIPRVVTGQGKWAVWREEARWVGSWAGGKEQNFFFYNLLTAFLGSHREWLDLLSPASYRRLHRRHHRSPKPEDSTLASRTVIVSNDKMAARRLIFLLSTFLPTSRFHHDVWAHRPSTSTSFKECSQSPPSTIQVSRQPSLRRSINRRGQANQTAVRLQGATVDDTKQPRSSPDELTARDAETSTIRNSSLNMPSRTANLPIPSAPQAARKGHLTTNVTSAKNTAMPVAHFAIQRSNSSNAASLPRPGSSGSLASANLRDTLQRSNSANVSNLSNDSQSKSAWGSLASALGQSIWSTSTRRESTTDVSEIAVTGDDGLGISGVDGKPGDRRPKTKLQSMVDELHGVDGDLFAEDLEDNADIPATGTARASPNRRLPSDNSASTIPETPSKPPHGFPGSFQSPIKLSLNEEDGVIDVEIGSYPSPITSPLTAGYGSSSSLENSSHGFGSIHSCAPPTESEAPLNVAGWLSAFHEDFALQAVKPYPDLEKDIRHAMMLEPTPSVAATTPSLESGPTDKWVDVCSALVADATNFSVKRLLLRRRVRLVPMPSQPAITPGPFASSISGLAGPKPTRSQYGNPYTYSSNAPVLPMAETHLEQEFHEEIIMDMEDILITAIEKLLARSGQSSRVPSAASSRSSSRLGRNHQRGGSGNVEVGNLNATSAPLLEDPQSTTAGPALEVPKAECKRMILGALEEVVKREVAERKRRKDGTCDRGRTRLADSTLREGVRRWLFEVS